MIQALIEAWSPEAKVFRLGHREVPFSYFDVALLIGLLATRRTVVFKREAGIGEVEYLLMATMEDFLERGGGGDEQYTRTSAYIRIMCL